MKRMVLLSIVLFAVNIFADTAFWTVNAGNGNWNDPTKWINNYVPAPGDDVYFSNITGNVTITLTNDVTVGTFLMPTLAGTARNVTINGQNQTITINNGIEKTRAQFLVINANIALGGDIVISNHQAAGGTRQINLNGVISDGGNNYSITKVGSLPLMLTNGAAANTFGGELICGGGDVWINAVDKLGSAAAVRFTGALPTNTLMFAGDQDEELSKNLVVDTPAKFNAAPGIAVRGLGRKLYLTGTIDFQQPGDFGFYSEGGNPETFLVLSNSISGTKGNFLVGGRVLVPIANNAGKALGTDMVWLTGNSIGGANNNSGGNLYLRGPLSFGNDVLITNCSRGATTGWHDRMGAINPPGSTSDFSGNIYFWDYVPAGSMPSQGLIAFSEGDHTVVRFTGLITNCVSGVRQYGVIVEGFTGTVQFTDNNQFDGPVRYAANLIADVDYNGSFSSSIELPANSWVNLKGHGPIATPSGVYAYATTRINPGASIGTLTINGDFYAGAYSHYACEVGAGGASDTIDVQGTLTIENPAYVDILKRGEVQPTDVFTIYTFGSLDGAAANLVLGGGVFKDAVFYQDGAAIKVSNLVYTAPIYSFADHFTGADGTWITAPTWRIRNTSGADAMDSDMALTQPMYWVGDSNEYVINDNQLRMYAGLSTQAVAVGGMWYAPRWVLQPLANGEPVHVKPAASPTEKIYISFKLGDAGVRKAGNWGQNQYLQLTLSDTVNPGDVGAKLFSGYIVRLFLDNASNVTIDCIARDNSRLVGNSIFAINFGSATMPYADVVGGTIQLVIQSNNTVSVALDDTIIAERQNLIPSDIAEDLMVSLFHMSQAGGEGEWYIDDFEIKPVPEPMGLLLLSGIMTLWAQRRRR